MKGLSVSRDSRAFVVPPSGGTGGSASLGAMLARPAALVVASLMLALLGFKTLTAFPSFFVEDDAWFYVQVGYNLGATGWSTFDGIHTTSGYHLGWAGMLGAVSAATSLISPDKSLFLIAAIGVYFLLALIAVDCFGRTVMEKAALFFFVFYPGLLMESQLLATLLLTACHFLLAEKKSPLAYVALLLVPLVRIDAAVMLVPLVLYHLARKDFDGFWKSCACAGLGVAAHFGVMLLAFGKAASVSSLMKAYASSTSSVGDVVRANVHRYGRYELAVFAVLLLLGLAAAWAARRRGRGLNVLCVIAGPAVFTLVHVAANPILRNWYFSPAFFVLALVLIRCEAKTVRFAFLMLVCALAVRETRNGCYFFVDDAATQRAEKAARFLGEVRSIVPEDEPIFQIDGCGYTGFFSGRHIVNGDGLMNDYDYLDKLKANRLRDYLRENEIGYVITNSPVGGPKVIDHHGLVLTRDDLEKMAEAGNQEIFRALVLWRIRDSYFVPVSESGNRGCHGHACVAMRPSLSAFPDMPTASVGMAPVFRSRNNSARERP